MAAHSDGVTEGGATLPGGTGYICGGATGTTSISTIQKFNFATEAASSFAGTLAIGHRQAASSSCATHGMMTGGLTSTSTMMRHAETVAFSDDTVAVRTTALGTATTTPGACGSSTHSYVAGGDNGSIFTTLITKIDYATRTGTALGAALATGRASGGGVYNATHGYYLGGNNGSTTTEIDGVVFATDAANNPSAALGTANFYPSPVMSDTKGYAADFYGIFGFTFSSETVATLSATMPTARNAAAALNSTTTGYFCGASSASTEIDGLTFATEAATNPSATLPTGVKHASGMSYKIAGSSPTADTSTAMVGGTHTAAVTATATHDAQQGTPLSDSHTASATAGDAPDAVRSVPAAQSETGPSAITQQGATPTYAAGSTESSAATVAADGVQVHVASANEVVVASASGVPLLTLRVIAAGAATATDTRDAVMVIRAQQAQEQASANAASGALQTFLVVGNEAALAAAIGSNTLAMHALVNEAAAAVSEQVTLVHDPDGSVRMYVYFPALYGHRLYCLRGK